VRPFPYTIKAGEVVRQSVRIAMEGTRHQATAGGIGAVVQTTLTGSVSTRFGRTCRTARFSIGS